VTAYKPYTITNNCFQLLDNLQVNDSPIKVSQPGKDYSSADRIRIARVKGESQVSKVTDKTHLRNASFNKTDTKNNLTIPVIVKGQALTSKSNPTQRQSSKTSHRKDHKALIIGDSHTRLCATNVKSEIKDNYDVQGLVKPGTGGWYISDHSQQ